MVPVGAGTTPTIEEEKFLLDDFPLIRCTPENVDVSIKCTSAQVFEILDISPKQMEWTGEHQEFLDKCVEMVRIWTPATSWREWNNWTYNDAYGEPKDRCMFAVNLSIPSRVIKDRIQLMVNCINHHSGTSIFEFRTRAVQYFGYPELRTYIGRRLFTCWLDFAVRRERINEAQPPPIVVDLEALPENVLDTSAPTSTSATATTASGSSASAATTATSAAETRSSAQPTQAVESAPNPTSQPPKLPVLHQPLNIPPVADWLAGINDEVQQRRAASPVPASGPRRLVTRFSTTATSTTASTSATSSALAAQTSPGRPSSTTSTSSLPQSPTRRRVQQSSTREKTPSPTTSARGGPLTRSRSGHLTSEERE